MDIPSLFLLPVPCFLPLPRVILILQRRRDRFLSCGALFGGPGVELFGADAAHLQALDQHYSKLQVITVLYDSGDSGAIENAIYIMNTNNVSLPALRYNNSMKQAFGRFLTSAALPTTVFVDQDGHFVKCVNGAKSYDDWCAIINGML